MSKPVVVYEPEKVEVKFTEKQLARYRELANREESLPWEWGDQLLADFPMGVKDSGVIAHLEALAERPDVSVDSSDHLGKLREVAAAWPDRLRSRSASFAAHRLLASPKYGNPDDRRAILDQLAEESENGRVTTRQVKAWRLRQSHGVGTKSKRPISDAYLGAIDKEKKVAKHLLWLVEKFGDKDPPDLLKETLKKYAPMFRAGADLIEAASRGEDLPSAEELREAFEVEVWDK